MKTLKIIMTVTAVLFAVPAAAAPAVSAQAYGVDARLGVAGGTLRATGALPLATGTAPTAFDHAGTAASVNERLSLVGAPLLDITQSLRTGLVTTRAASPFPATLSGLARASVADANLSLATEVLNLGLLQSTLGLGIAADLITSETGIGFNNAGTLVATHNSAIANLRLTGALGALVGTDALARAAATANSVVDLGAVKLFLNEQGETRGAAGLFAYTNALRVQVTDLALQGRLVSGQIVLGRSQVEVTGAPAAAAVPEPASWLAMILGAALTGAALRRRRAATRLPVAA